MKIGRSRDQNQAWTLIEVIMVIFVLVVLAFVFLPQLARRKGRPSRTNCITNLKLNGLAFRQWTLDNNGKFPWQVSTNFGGTMELVGSGIAYVHFQVMSNELSTPRLLNCPSDLKRTAATNFDSDLSDAKVSYFVGVDADQSQPQMILSGDDNLAINGVPAKPGLLTLRTNSAVTWTKDRHVNAGNILLSDGSAQQATSSYLQRLLQATGSVTNRLVLP